MMLSGKVEKKKSS